MNDSSRMRERLAWTAALAALATSASWLLAIDLALAAKLGGIEAPQALRVARVLIGAAWLVIRHAGPLLPLALLVPGLAVLFARALRPAAGLERRTGRV